MNKGLLKREGTGITFDRGETEVMLSDPEERETDVWTGIRRKFGSLGMSEDTRVFARNLRLRDRLVKDGLGRGRFNKRH